MKTLIIAEKPSVARDIASALGKIKKQGDCYEDERYVVASAVGHLVELFMPEDIDQKKYSFWRLAALPIIPDRFKLKPIEKTKAKFNELKKLMKREDVERVVNACDAGREGELIFTYIYELAKCKKPVARLWMQSMTPAAIRTAFERLRDGGAMESLQAAARCRSEADWLIGINGTRALTTRLYGSRSRNVASVGRVQTPTLAMVCERELTIRSFEPRPYWRLLGRFGLEAGDYAGVYQRPGFKKDPGNEHDRADRIWDQAEAERVLAELAGEGDARVEEKLKRTRQSTPRLYDLTSLQREANGRYGFSAGRTLRLAQALYERHKVITYPRTDSRALPEDYIPVSKDVLGRIGGELAPHARTALDSGWVKPDKRIFNNAGISDHFAIIPTGESKKLNEDEAKVFDLISRRFVAVFFPAAEFDVTTRTSTVAGHAFRTEGKVLAVPGWLAVYGTGGKLAGKEPLPGVGPADGDPPRAAVLATEMEAEATRPPARYTEATLLTAMETAGKFVEDEELAEAMKEKGLGTPATRASIIDHLVAQKYMEREGRELVPTAKAENLLDFLQIVRAEELTSPTMTGEWEHRLHLIEDGKLSRQDFMDGIAKMATQVVERTRDFNEDDAATEETSIVSPTDGKPLLKNFRSYRAQDGGMTIYRTMGNRKLSDEEVAALVADGSVGPLDGFRSKAGKPYSAVLRLGEDHRVKFDFGNGDNGNGDNGQGEPVDYSTYPVVGVCPFDKTNVRALPNAYASEDTLDGKAKRPFRLQRTLLQKAIPSEQVTKMLEKGRTDLLEGFVSNRTKRRFSAFLVIDEAEERGWKFEFQKRAPKKGAKKAAKKAAKKKTAAPAD